MSYNSLVSAIDCTKKYEEEKSKQEERCEGSNDEQEEVKKQIAEIKAQEKVERKALEGKGEEKKEGEDGIEREEKKKDDKKLIKIKEKMVMIILMMKLI